MESGQLPGFFFPKPELEEAAPASGVHIIFQTAYLPITCPDGFDRQLLGGNDHEGVENFLVQSGRFLEATVPTFDRRSQTGP